jgi:hypothetical protein
VFRGVRGSDMPDRAHSGPAQQPARVPHSGAALWCARLMLAIVTVLIWSVYFGDRYFGRGYKDAVVPHALEMMFAFQAPFLVALTGLIRGASRLALGLATAAATTLLVPLLPLAALSLAFGGVTAGTPDMWTPLSMAALAGALSALAVSAVVALWLGDGSKRGALATGFMASILYASLLVGLSRALQAGDASRWASVARNNRDAERYAAKIAKCAWGYAGQHAARGFPPDLAALGPHGSGCLLEMEGETRRGFQFTYFASPADEQGLRASFSLCGRPVHYKKTGTETVVLDSTDHRDRAGGLGQAFDADATDSTACGARWGEYEDLGSSLLFCLLSYAAAHPAEGFPRDLGEIRTCPMSSGVHGHWSYRAGTPNAAGRVVGYEANWKDYGSWSYFTDQTGILRVADDHSATASDPTYEEFRTLRRARPASGAAPSP